ncbi:hypothetical protein IAT38_001413 [Cryptococcus sp. DSM 104549]
MSSPSLASSPIPGTSSIRSRRPAALGPSTARDVEPAPNSASTHTTEPPSASSSNVYFPGGLPLPAVKGTRGGIESPRHVRASPSLTLRETPGSPLQTPSTFRSNTVPHQSASPSTPVQRSLPGHSLYSSTPPRADEQQTMQARPSVVFKSDPTVKSCLLGLKMEAKDEIAKLFGVA